MTVYVQVYLFIILYSYWIATNIIQYLLYLVVIVYEYLFVFTQLYPRKWGQLLYQRIMQPFRSPEFLTPIHVSLQSNTSGSTVSKAFLDKEIQFQLVNCYPCCHIYDQ